MAGLAFLHRVRRFFENLRTSRKLVDDPRIDRYLSPAERTLFTGMPVPDQHHALKVLSVLERAGHQEMALARAALLHDIGKTRAGIRLWHRVLVVLLQSFAPGILMWLAGDGRPGWRYPWFALVHHAARGAALLEGTGSDPETIFLVREHQTPLAQVNAQPEAKALLVALQAADGTN